jgi:hypothetical protein
MLQSSTVPRSPSIEIAYQPRDTQAVSPRSIAKTTLVTTLAALLLHSPRLAMLLGRLVLAVWPGFRRA